MRMEGETHLPLQASPIEISMACRHPGERLRELIRNPEKADQTHWTGKKFHGCITEELNEEIGYGAVLRRRHDEGFRLKVPRSRPNGQDEQKTKAFVQWLADSLTDPDTDHWFLDQTGVEGDPRPRRRWAMRGEKIAVPYEGSHVRMNVTGMG